MNARTELPSGPPSPQRHGWAWAVIAIIAVLVILVPVALFLFTVVSFGIAERPSPTVGYDVHVQIGLANGKWRIPRLDHV